MKKIELKEGECIGACVPYVSDHGYRLVDVFILTWPKLSFRCETVSEDDLGDGSKALFKSAACLNIEFQNTIQFCRKAGGE